MSLPDNAPFTIVDLEQDTDVWRQWRTGGIGGSDAPTIMGENPWRSYDDLLINRRSPAAARSRPMTPAMARGVALEPVARAAYCKAKGIILAPLCAENIERPWMRCSLDGICLQTMQAVEIKCGQSAYRTAQRHRAVPRLYYGQLQHTMAVMGLSEMDFFCFVPGRLPLTIPVPRDDAYIERLITRETDFWAAVNR